MEKLFAEASEVLATFQKEVMGFIEDGERSMLGEAEADLRWKEERRAKLAQCKQNLENVPSTDTIYFLQVGWGKKELTVLYFGVLSHIPWRWGPGTLGSAGWGVSLCQHSPLPSPLPGGPGSQNFPSIAPTPSCLGLREADVLPRVGTWV